MHSWEYASRVTKSARCGIPPGCGGAGRPEKRVHARSKPPHQKCEGLDLPRKGPRNRFRTRSACVRMRQQRCAASASYDACSRSAVKCTVSAISRSEEHTSELQSRLHLVCRLLLE